MSGEDLPGSPDRDDGRKGHAEGSGGGAASLLIRRLREHAEKRPGEVAVREYRGLHRGRTATWAQLRKAACLFLQRMTAERGGAVMVVSKNRIEVLAVLLGALSAGRRVLLASPLATRSELAQLAEAASVSILVGESRACSLLQGTVSRILPIDSIPIDGAEAFGDLESRHAGSILVQSSGTTGPPKIAIREAPALDAVGRNLTRALHLHASDRMLVTIPLYHSYGIDMALLAGVVSGCSLDLHEGFNPAAVESAVRAGEVSVWPAVPVMLDAVSRGPGPLQSVALDRTISAGSPLPLPIARRFEKKFGRRVGQVYGTSEFGSVTCNDPTDSSPDFDPCCAGVPMEDVEIRVLDIDGSGVAEPVTTGAEGEIAVTAPSMMSGYLDGSEARLRLDDVEYLRTGDTGFLDARGRLHLTGRSRLFIDVGAQKVNPIEVEAVLMQFPGVRDAVVLASPYSATADRVKAILLPEDGHTLEPAQIREFARQHLSAFKIPRSFEIRKDLPRSPTGKILRHELQKLEDSLTREPLRATRWEGSDEET